MLKEILKEKSQHKPGLPTAQFFIVYFVFNAYDILMVRVFASRVELAIVRASTQRLTRDGGVEVQSVSVYVEGHEPGAGSVLNEFNDDNSRPPPTDRGVQITTRTTPEVL